MRVIDVTTNSMEAYNYFLQGKENYDKFYPIEACYNLEKAIALDSTFATAYLYLSDAYSSLQETKKRNDALEKAYRYSEKATEKEKLIIEASYASIIERDGEKRFRILKELTERYSKEKLVFYELGVYYKDRHKNYEAKDQLNKALSLDPNYSPALNIIAYVYADLGDYKKAIESLQKYSELNPDDANPFDSMADYYWMIGQPEIATEYYLKALDIKPDFSQTAAKLAYISAEKENYEDSERWINKAIENVDFKGLKAVYFWVRAFFNSWQGKIKQSVKDLNTAKELSQTIENKYTIAGSNWLHAYICYDTDELNLINQYFLGWLEYRRKYSPADYNSTLNEHKFLMALIDIKQNALDSAKIKLAELKSQQKDIISNRLNYRINLLDAEISFAEKSPVKAIVTLKNAEPQNVPILAFPEIVAYNTPYLKDILARSYQKAGQLDNAISEYERLITYNPKRKERYLINPRYHYRLAVLYEEKGLKDKAVKECKRFLDLWKNADKNLPEPIDAKKRLDKLLGK
jgi:tetratricopeptide (TPR) repeat protein